MCGILGYYSSVDQHVSIKPGLEKIKHRGPDDSGIFFDQSNNVALGHTRLSIIDLSQHGHQPIYSSCGQVVMVYNGEIYNYLNLKNDLASKGYSFIGDSDTEVLLNLYLDKGYDMLSLLNGIFSFSIFDARSGSLFLARDRFGVKPLYYNESSSGFSFSRR